VPLLSPREEIDKGIDIQNYFAIFRADATVFLLFSP